MHKRINHICLLIIVNLIAFNSHAQPEYDVQGRLFTSLEKAKANPDSVERLRLRRKNFKVIPAEVYLFKNLKELDLGNNKISKIPAEISQLEKLEVLRLGRNRIKSIGIEITGLKNIKYLDLGMNEIAALPHETGQLKLLEFLQIWGTEITVLPASIVYLENLKWLDMRNIILTDSEKEDILDMFPKTEIYFSEGCNCGK